jgi:hypothetical protein
LSASNLGNLARGLTGLGVLPDEAWRQAWHNAVEVAGAGWSLEVAASLRLRQREFDALASTPGVVVGTQSVSQSQGVIGRRAGVGRKQKGSKQGGRSKKGSRLDQRGRSVG